MKKVICTGIVILISAISIAQDPKKTHNYEIFGERIAQAIFSDLSGEIYGNGTIKLPDVGAGRNSTTGYLVKNKELESLANTLGISVDELKKHRKIRRTEIEHELTFIKMKYNYGITDWGHVILENVHLEEKPSDVIKTADIILEAKQAQNKIYIVLENCMQTDTEWLLGDHLYASGTNEKIEADTRKANELLANLTELQIKESVFDINGRWSSKKAIITYDNYPQKIILEDDDLRWTELRKLDFMLLNNGKLSIGVFLVKKGNYNAYSNKWSYRNKSKTIFFSSDEPGIYESRTVTVKSLSDREMIVEYSDMGVTTTYFLDYSTPGRKELTTSELKNSQWFKLYLSKTDLSTGAKSSKMKDHVYKGLAIYKNGKFEEINLKYENPIDFTKSRDPLYIYSDEYLGREKTDGSAVSFIDKDELKGLMIEDELWLPKIIKNKVKWALISVQGPITSFTIYEVPTSSKMQISNVPKPEPNPEENRKLYLQRYDGKLYQNMMVGFRKKVSELVLECKELSDKIKNKEKGYGASNQERIALEFNQWYKENNPEAFNKSLIIMN